MIKKKPFWISLITLLFFLIAAMASGCQSPQVTTPQIPPDPFTTTWSLGEGERSFSISGNRPEHVTGIQAEFLLRINNYSGGERWQGEYCILLVDRDGIVKEIAREQFEVPVGLETQQKIMVTFPEDFKGPLGLCFVVPQRGTTITTVWVGEKDNVIAGPWPIIKTCPYYLTEEGSREPAERFVRNSPAFTFDGIEESLTLVRTENIVLKPEEDKSEKQYQFKGWEFTFRFESRHAGYGDRTGQQLLQVITPHEAIILVEQGRVKSAIMDGVWDMMNQQMLDDMEINPAPIHEVEVIILESFPPQVRVFIKGGLRDSCTTFHDAVITRENNSINIKVTTQRPREAICAQVYGFFERTLDLGSDFITGVNYNLKVNDQLTTFEVH